MTVWKGRRWSTANAYLKPARGRKNLIILRGEAQRVVIENGAATGVEVLHGGRVQKITANREVILAASSINSPKLLLLSGIGPADELGQMGIDVVADRPGVGRNLQDHLELYVQQGISQPITLNGRLGLISKGLIGLQWLTAQSGLGATNHFESCAFVRSRAGIPYPDIQFHFLAGAIRYDGKVASAGHGCQAHVGPMRSRSRGSVTLRSADPEDAPVIRFNYMSHEEDWQEFRTAIRLVREIFGQSAFDDLRGDEIQPGRDIQSDEALDAFIAAHAESAYHPCGTCKMGRATDSHAVVDPQCRVIGVDRLRVADSSIFPQITNGNINAPSIMVGEKASDHILGRDPLPRSNLEPWVHPNWQEQQR
jgi:choline dehydrogenase